MPRQDLKFHQLQLLTHLQLREILKQRTQIPRMFSFIRSAYGNARVRRVSSLGTVCTLTGSGGPDHKNGIWMGHVYWRDQHCYYLNCVVGEWQTRILMEQFRPRFNRISEFAKAKGSVDYTVTFEEHVKVFPLFFYAWHPPTDRDLYLLIWQVLDLLEGRQVSLRRIATGL